MFGLYSMGAPTRDVPFRDVVIHGLVGDATGDKMRKLMGNIMDPLDDPPPTAPTRSASRSRTYSPQSKRIPLSPKKLEGNRNFCNKIWNATRYSLG